MNIEILVAVLAALIACHVLSLLIELVHSLLFLKHLTGACGAGYFKRCEEREQLGVGKAANKAMKKYESGSD